MKNNRSQKQMSWTSKDVALIVFTYAINLIIVSLLLSGAIFIEHGVRVDMTTLAHFVVMTALVLAVIVSYFLFEDRDFLKSPLNSEMLFLIIELSLVICFVSGKYVETYLRPLPLAALLTLFLTNRRTAVFINFIFCIFIFLFDSFIGTSFWLGNYPALLMGVTSGFLAIFCMDNVYSRIKLLYMSVIISLPTLVCVAMSIIEFGGENIIYSLVAGAFSGPLSIASFMILLPVFEVAFRKVSNFKLAEYTDHKSKIIKKMIQQAPGTFNHSIVVSNIAEACAIAIGEDALLARTCAYYHDVGKLRRPEFFKENQAGGINPHDDLTPELSANIIKSHTQDGYNLVTKNRLPKEIADVCVQHHGTMPILYFYDKAKKYTDGDVDIAQYCYPGPKPQTKISAIIMIADGCEAAARSLQDRSRSNVKTVVRNIVNDRMALGQFEECEITLKELNIIMHTVINNLTGIYHSRIEYPKVNLDGLDM